MALAGGGVPAAAQTVGGVRLTELTLEQLGEIRVISVSKQSEEVWRTPVAIHVITAEEIRRSGATSIPEVLRLAPGVEVARVDSDHWSIGVRGFGDAFSKSLVVLVDGRSLYTPLFAGIYWPAHDTLLEDVDRIEVIRGPGGTIWGGNAVNGVINIITKRASDTQGTLATVGVGSVDRGTAAVRYGGGNGQTFDYRVYAKTFNRGPLSHADGGDYDDWWMGQGGFRADWTRSPGDRITVQGDISGGRHGQRISLSSISPPATFAVDDPADIVTGNLSASWRRQLASGNEIQFQAYYDGAVWAAPHFEETRNTLDLDFVHGFGLGARQRLVWGAGARWSPGAFRPTTETLDFSPRTETATYYSAFLQDDVQLVPERLTFSAGAKIEHNNYTGVEVQPSVRLMATPADAHAVWGAVSRAVRTPSRIERGIRLSSFVTATPLPVFLQVNGSDDFQSEELVGYEAGYRTLAVPRVYLDLSVFHHELDDLASFGLDTVTAETMPPPLRAVVHVPYVNGVQGHTNGVEIAPDWRPAPWAQVKGSYSFLAFDLRTKPNSIDLNGVARYEGSSPRHQTRLQLRFTLPRGVELDVAHRYVSDLQARAADAYQAADLRVAWSPRPGLQLAVQGRNLFDPRHVEFDHAPPPAVSIPRSIYASVTWAGR